LLIGDDIDERADALDLPARFVLTMGSTEPRKAIADLIDAIDKVGADDLPLLVAGMSDADIATLLPEGTEPPTHVRGLGYLADADLAVVLARASVFVYPSIAEGFGMPLVEAMHFGLPVIHSDDPALVEVAGGSGIIVDRAGTEPYAQRLAAAIREVIDDSDLEARLRVQARDRAAAFTWRTAAEKVWQLHADL
jgi:glycosyltransferase involved in cell wall biosynthesis